MCQSLTPILKIKKERLLCHIMVYSFPLPVPYTWWQEGGVQVTIYSFLFSVLAGIVSGIIVEIMLVLLRKWI